MSGNANAPSDAVPPSEGVRVSPTALRAGLLAVAIAAVITAAAMGHHVAFIKADAELATLLRGMAFRAN